MASVDEQSVIKCCTADRAEVEVVQIIDDVKKAGKKSLEFIPIQGLSQSEKDRLINRRKIIKPPKNIILVEGDPKDDMGVQKRQMRCFPPEELLSAKIKMANGTDYSNHFIEQHYNPNKKCQKRSKKIGIVGLIKTKKISLDDLGLEFDKKKTNSSSEREIEPEIIDLTDSSNEMEIIDCKNVEDSSVDKFFKKLKNIAVCPRLVPYSSSDDESDDFSDADFSPSKNLDESNEILKSRQHFIREGLDEHKFKFENKMATDESGNKNGIQKIGKQFFQID